MLASAPPHLAPDEHSGRKLGKYEILCRLSTGGMSEIFLAFQRGLAGFTKFVVLKQILPDIRDEEPFVRMFLREAKITAALTHPNIAQVFDLDIDDGEMFLAMEFVQGATLVDIARACRAKGELIPLGLTLAAVRDTARALHYAHTFTDPTGRIEQIIHRDVAEKNVMVSFEGVTKLLDFGIAKNLASMHRTRRGILKGTVGYIAPEQISGHELDARSDIFSLGVVLYQCLTEVMLFHGNTPEEQLQATLRGDVVPPSRRNPLVTPELDAVVLKALARDREDRFATALDFARELERVAGDLIWRPDQSAEVIKRLFADRYRETHMLLGKAQAESSDLTSEFMLDRLMGPAQPARALERTEPVPDAAASSAETGSSENDPLSQTWENSGADDSRIVTVATVEMRKQRGEEEDEDVTVQREITVRRDLPEGRRATVNALPSPSVRARGSNGGRAARAQKREPPADDSPWSDGEVTADGDPASATREEGPTTGAGSWPVGFRARPRLAAGALVLFIGATTLTFLLTGSSGEVPEGPPEPQPLARTAPERPPPPPDAEEAPRAPAPRARASAAAPNEAPRPDPAPKKEAVSPQPVATRIAEPARKPAPVPAPKSAPKRIRLASARPATRTDAVMETGLRASEPAKVGPGQLTLVTDTPAQVLFKAQSLGTTPLQKVPLPPGTHTLRLRGPDDTVRLLQVRISASEVTSMKVKLDTLKED